jgi:hypothetical protein
MLEPAAIAIDMLAKPATRLRPGAGAYVNGLWVPATATNLAIRAVVLAMPPQDVMNLPEGIRTQAEWVIWSRTELSAGIEAGPSPRAADEILYAGRTMRVIHVWDRIEGGFYKAALRTVAT